MFRRFVSSRNRQTLTSPADDHQELVSNGTTAATETRFPALVEHDLDVLGPKILLELRGIVGAEYVLTEEADLIT